MFHKVKKIKPLDNYKLQVYFEDMSVKIYDVAPLFKRWVVFEALREDRKLFASVKVDAGGYGISWNEDIDLSCNELWENGVAADLEIA